ncbi:MAG: TolC family outer membrane protein [Saccharospirillum sp.]
MKGITLVTALAVSLISTGALAQVSLSDVYRQALLNDPTLTIQQLNAETASAQVRSGRSELLPKVNASTSYEVSGSCAGAPIQFVPNFDDCQSVGARINATQNIFALAAVDAYEALKLNATKAEIETEAARQTLMVRVAEAYIDVLRALEGRDSTEAQLRAVERQFEQTEQRYEVGLVTITDVLDAQATLDQTRVALIRAESQYDITLQNLSVLTGEVPDGVYTLNTDFPIEMPQGQALDEWVTYALDNHPDILAAQKGLESGERELQARRNNRLPVVSANASINYGDDPTDGLEFEDRLSSSIALSVTVPLYTGGATQSQIVTTGLRNNIAEQQLELLKRNIRVQVSNLYREVRTSVQNVAAQQQVVRSRESALQATEVGYEVGTRNIVEVLNAQQALFGARQAYANARFDYLLNSLRLKQAAGQLREADLDAIDAFLLVGS